MSIAVHPTDPALICSTSNDHTTRIYDLAESANFPVENPSWPNGGLSKRSPVECLAGPAFGLRANEGEGKGRGRCVAVLVGGSSGGHLAPVQSAVSFSYRINRTKDCLLIHLYITGISPQLPSDCHLWGKSLPKLALRNEGLTHFSRRTTVSNYGTYPQSMEEYLCEKINHCSAVVVSTLRRCSLLVGLLNIL